jgi:uncharacterized membrane protein YbjE (DUF340 family)
MIIVIAVVLVGACTGFLVREKKDFLKAVTVLVNGAIYVLLLLLGVSVGSNRTIITNLATIGMKAAAISLAAVLGSIAVGFVFQHFSFGNKVNEK